MSILNLVRSELLDIPVYISSPEQDALRLHANELPWSAVNVDAINLNHYPETELKNQVQKQLAKRYQISSDQITITRGSDDGIDLIMRLFLKPLQDAFMQFPPTFFMYAFYARLQQAQIIQCPLDAIDNFSISLERIKSCWQEQCKLIMLCNPNNPTASLIDLQLITSLCEYYKNRSVIVVDEAYMEFANAESAISLLSQYDNLIVLRTLSKAYGLAGLRLGAVIAQPQIIQTINKIMAPYPLSSVVMHLALQALANEDWFTVAIEKIKAERVKLLSRLVQNPLIEKIYPSEANFILIKTAYANEIATWFSKQGISIRSFLAKSSLQNHLRITVGDEQQNLLMMTALSSFQNSICGS
ncbi:MAG: histidinol-phosphate transaminase [Legionella sp.]